MTGNKRNKARALMVFLLVFVMGFSSVVVYAEESDVFGQWLTEEFGAEFAANYSIASEIAAHFFDSLPTNRMGETMFPLDFGGAYFDEFGNFNVLVVDSPIMALSGDRTLDALSNNQALLSNIRLAVFPYVYLVDVMNLLDQIIPNAIESESMAGVGNIRAWYVDVISNRVVVALDELSEQEIASFRKNIFDSPALMFIEVSELAGDDMPYLGSLPLHEEVAQVDTYFDFQPMNVPGSIEAGSRFYVYRNGQRQFDEFGIASSGSVGFRADTTAGLMGFITAAHFGFNSFVMRPGDELRNPQGHTLGTVYQAIVNGPDAAWIRMSPSFWGGITNFSMRFGALDPTRAVSNLMIGSVVNTQGATSGNSSGTVSMSMFSTTVDAGMGRTVTFSGVARVRVRAQGGDSGGMVYARSNALTNSGIVGIMVSRCPNDLFGHTLVSRATNIRNYYNIVLR